MTKTMEDINYWVFSNKSEGRYGESDWDMNTILDTKEYYFKKGERNRSNIEEGDIAYMRIYGESYIGKFRVGRWKDDPKSKDKYDRQCGSFTIEDLHLWERPIPQGLVMKDLSNQNFRRGKSNSV